jgi:predicted DNA-binding protein
MRRKSVLLTEDQIGRVNDLCEKFDRPFSFIVRHCVNDMLEELEDRLIGHSLESSS